MGNPASDPRRFRRLPPAVSVHETADRCRRAVIEFVSGTAGGWSRAELELWLGAPYHAAIGAFPLPPGVRGAEASPVEGNFESSLMNAADVVRDLLATCARPRTPAFVEHAVELGFVAGAKDASGALGWVPLDVSGMTLVDRVASLLAADFLTRPKDYRSVTICEACGAVSFEWTACDHVDSRVSGVVRSHDGAPVSYAAIFPPPEH